MKIFVTGGAGFIGSNFIHYFINNFPKSTVINYDKFTYAGNPANLSGIQGNYYAVQADICNFGYLKEMLKHFSPDMIVAFAAESHVDRSITNPQEFLTTNILGTECILRAAKELDINKVIHISTDEVYGSLDDPLEADERSAFEPNSPYSASKAAGDLLCNAYFKTYKLPVTVIRGSNCFGPRQHVEKLIPKSITSLLSNKKIQIYGKGKNYREWIYVDDFCRGVVTVMLKGVIGEAYNLGGGADNRVDNNTIAKQICKILKAKQTNIEYIADRLGHDKRYALNSDKLKSLGWAPQESLKTGLEKTVDWYRENLEWWKPLLEENQ